MARIGIYSQPIESGFSNEAIRTHVAERLAEGGLTPWQDNLSSSMSGSQQQRVAIARALALNPALILADEPTGNLDSETADTVIEMMHTVNRKDDTTFLIVTHNMDIAARCDRIIEVVDGQISGKKTDAAP